MNREKFYILVIVALFILNGILLFLHFKRVELERIPRKVIIERLQFDEQQIKQYDELISAHLKASRSNEANMNELKNALYLQLNNNSNNSLKADSLVQNIAEMQKNFELINFKHFQAIKKICKPEQLPLFEKLVGELSQFFGKKTYYSQNKSEKPKD